MAEYIYQVIPRRVRAYELPAPGARGDWLVIGDEGNGAVRLVKRLEFETSFEPVEPEPAKPQPKRRAAKKAKRRRGPPGKYDWKLAKHMWHEGKLVREIAEAIGAPPSTVRSKRDRDGWPRRYNPIDWVKARRLWDEGEISICEIGRRIGVTDGSIHYHAKAHGWPPRGKAKQEKANPGAVRREIAARQCPHCSAMTHTDPCEVCHTYIRGAA
jgi:hypothetical protein